MSDECNGVLPIMGVALFGLGRAGTIHFKNLIHNPRVQLLYIIEQDTNKAHEIIMLYRLDKVQVIPPEGAKAALEDNSVNGVLVCSPTYTHEEIVRSALKHGKAVFCEKPISNSVAGTEACYDEAFNAGLPLACSFNRRFDPSVRDIHDRVQRGEIGPVHVIKTCSRDHPLPHIDFLKVSGGLFHDCAIHDLDMVCWILDEFPVSVYAQGHCHDKGIADLDDIDTVAIVMKFASGILCTIDLSRHASYGYDQRLEVFGSQGMLVSENQKPTEVTSHSSAGVKSPCYKYSFPQRYADSYIASMENFISVMLGTEKVIVSKKDTLSICKVASACEESYKSGQPIILNYT